LDQCARDPVMIGSGWQIYDASPLFGFTFP
jgi:thiosulfate reductase cytochrome b subunit